jgi:hypothetical protein
LALSSCCPECRARLGARARPWTWPPGSCTDAHT